MVQVLRAPLQVVRRSDSAKCLKIMDEVCLVAVSAGQSQFGPIDIASGTNALHHLLKAAHPAEQLGCQPDLIAKKLDEVPLAETGLLSHQSNRAQTGTTQLLDAKTDGGMPLRRLSTLLRKYSDVFIA